ncbi:UBX domain-containing protein 7-like isoform X2 [Gigantopelta aegis]|uniref:UBX domain-containing protein 7-like isoform X2 n=1 Tax=Gigantopelta aegis TaxID=1735272 RepID=UPI001B88A96C|nr:UBX domain-containing protein 7-like isoform X2 [Gigantopelta aegis]
MAEKSKPEMETDSVLQHFCAVTGAEAIVGERFLEACNGNLELAIGMHMDSNDVSLMNPLTHPSTSSALDAPVPGTSVASDDAAATASTEDDIRAPIPQKRECLIEDVPSFGFRRRRGPARSVFDGFRDFQAEARQQELFVKTGVPSKKKTLEDLFRPPIDLTFKGTFHSARDAGTNQNKWLMVNIQNVQEFLCQVLNRDVWSNPVVKDLIKSHFIFWQVYHDSEEGKKYMQFYEITTWPYIAILDPQTGENLAVWNKVNTPAFSDLITEFLALHPDPEGADSPPCKKHKLEHSLLEASEEDQLQEAIQQSLKQPEKSLNSSLFGTSDSECLSDDLETFSDSDHNSDSGTEPLKSVTNKSPTKTKPCAQNNVNTKHVEHVSVVKRTTELSVAESRVSSKAAKSPINNTCIPCDSRLADKTKCVVDRASSHRSSISFVEDFGRQSSIATVETDGQKDVDASGEKEEITNNQHEWQHFMGNQSDPTTNLMIRFPDGKRQQLSLPCSSTLQALVKYVISSGFSDEQYELVTNFPRRQLSKMDFDMTIKDAGLHPQETIFVQSR